MGSCKFLSVMSIVCHLRKLFRRHRQSRREPTDDLIVVDPDQVSQTAKSASLPPIPSVDEDPEPRLVDDIRQDQPLSPPTCGRLLVGDLKILGDHPSRAGAFADIWDGSLADDRVVVKFYRIYSTVDPTYARMVRFP